MPNFKFKGIDAYIDRLQKLDSVSRDKFLGKAIYDGAKVIADNTKRALQSLPIDQRPSAPHRVGITKLQKEGLIESYGIAPMRTDGDFTNVKVGFDGYNNVITKRWPMGQPNIMIARSIESGTSFMTKNPVISKTQNAFKDECIETIGNSIAKQIDDLFG